MRHKKDNSNINFRGKYEDEEVIFLLRRHWFKMLMLFFPSMLFLLAIIVIQIIATSTDFVTEFPLGKPGFYLFQSILLMFWWLVTAIIWVDYYLDAWIVTTSRIINIEQLGLFRREISELEHGKIQDVTTEVKGFIPTLFNYGFVYTQTAGTKSRFVFKDVPDPVFVRTVIVRLQQKAQEEQIKKEGQMMRGKV